MACLAIPNSSLSLVLLTPCPWNSRMPLPFPSSMNNKITSSFFGTECRNYLGCKLALVPGRLWKTKSTERKVIYASLFGVGAPEALLIGVVALIVFGPKGLAEVARTLGKSLRAFQPTIQELQQVSKEFKKTLEEEIGLNELTSYDSNTSGNSMQAQQGQPSTNTRSEPVESTTQPTTNLVKVTEEQAKALVPEEQRKAAEAAAWGGAPPTKVDESEHGSGSEVVVRNVEASEV